MKPLFDTALDAMRQTIAAVPALAGFCPIPAAAPFAERSPTVVPATGLVESCPLTPAPEARALFDATRALAPHADWKQTYTEQQVGRAFLDAYGYFELIGVDGHFHADGMSAFLLYFGPHLHYRRHWHVAEEIYYVIAGQAEFQVDGEPPSLLRPGDTRFHSSNQPHQTTMGDSALLCLVLWRGEGLTLDLNMEAAPGALTGAGRGDLVSASGMGAFGGANAPEPGAAIQ